MSTGLPYPIIATLAANTWVNITPQIKARQKELNLDPDAFYSVGVFSRGNFDTYLAFNESNDDNKAHKIPALVQWDNQNVPMQILKQSIFARSTNAAGDNIEFTLVLWGGK